VPWAHSPPPDGSPHREVAEREKGMYPARNVVIKSPRHQKFADATMLTPRSSAQAACSNAIPPKMKDNPWYAPQHNVSVVAQPERMGRKHDAGFTDDRVFAKDPAEINSQQIRVLRHQVRPAPHKHARAHAHARTHTHAHTRTHIRTHTHTRTHARTHTERHTQTRAHTHTHTHTHEKYGLAQTHATETRPDDVQTHTPAK